MKTALIGYTGFVGSNILRQKAFDELYNSKNINDLEGKEFDLVVCAGVPAVKWWANQNPDEDLAILQSLEKIYKTVKAKRFVLISTVDVYPIPFNVDENTAIENEAFCPYGKHRLMLEQALQSSFDHFHVIRLPGLFGKGLKKNILFDMLCGNMLEKINLDSSFQWYPLSRIWQDIQTVINNEISVVNFAVEPIATYKIREDFFSNLIVGDEAIPVAKYDMHTQYSDVFDSQKFNYIMNAEQILHDMGEWLKNPEVKCG